MVLNGQDTNKDVRVLLFGGYATTGPVAGSGGFHSRWFWANFGPDVGFFTTVKLD